MALRWQQATFEQLSSSDLYDALVLRSLVFVVEQKCIFLDMDGKDPKTQHLLGRDDSDRVVAYTRLVPPGVSYVEPSIGRVVTHPDVRRTGAGRELMRESIARVRVLWPGLPIRIGAQRYLERFYGELGFVRCGADYVEDGIDHLPMLRTGS